MPGEAVQGKVRLGGAWLGEERNGEVRIGLAGQGKVKNTNSIASINVR